MSREIKFRAWNSMAKKILHFGNPIGIMDNEDRYGTFFESFEKKMYCGGNYELMQFTGLKDKNGVTEIYEGDIMFRQIKNGKGKVIRECKATVVYVPELAGYYLVHDGSGTMLGSTYEELNDWAVFGEVIGNIYENRELLDSTK